MLLYVLEKFQALSEELCNKLQWEFFHKIVLNWKYSYLDLIQYF